MQEYAARPDHMRPKNQTGEKDLVVDFGELQHYETVKDDYGPPSVQETLGDPAASDFARWLEAHVEERAVVRDEYREVLSRLDQIDERIDGTNERLDRMEERFEKRFDQIDQRLDEQSAQFNQRIDAVNERFDGVNERFDAMNKRIDRLYEQMRVQTRWTVGTISLFGTIVTMLLVIAEFSA